MGSDLLAFRLYPVTCVCTAPSMKTLSYFTLTVTLTLSLPFLLFAPSSFPCSPTTPSPTLPLLLNGGLLPLPSIPNLLRFPYQAQYSLQFAPTAFFLLMFPREIPFCSSRHFFLQAQGSVSAKFTHEVSSFLPHLLWACAGWGQKLLGGTQQWGVYSHPLQISAQAAGKITGISTKPSFN